MIIDGKGLNEEQLHLVVGKQIHNKSKIGCEYFIKSNYINDVKKIIGKISGVPKITIDVGGGAAKTIVAKLLEEIGCDVITINDDLEKSSRGPDPTTNPLKDLISSTNGRDVGFAFDLDADRLVVVLNGKKMNPDVTLGLGVIKSLELG